MRDNRRFGTVLTALIAIAIVAEIPTAMAYPRPGRTQPASIAVDGRPANGISIAASVTSDGRYAVFLSLASNLVVGDTNEASDIFVRDLVTGVTERVSVANDGTQGDGESSAPSISEDGRYVAFQSEASNLVPADTNRYQDVFVHDRASGATERVSVTTEGGQANAPARNPSLSADGRFVTFDSLAPSLLPNGGRCQFGVPCSNIFVRDRVTGVTESVSMAADGSPGNGSAYLPTVNADGRYIAFRSVASNLVSGDTNNTEDVFVRDLDLDVTERVSVASNGTQGNAGSWYGAISADGRHVAFESLATNLVPADTNSGADVFVHDRETGTTERVSVASDGSQGNASSFARSISGDGRYIAFNSPATNLVAGDTNSKGDVFVHDRKTAATERLSIASDGTEGNADSSFPWVSSGGRYVAYNSFASNLFSGDDNGTYDVFVRDRGQPVGPGAISATVTGERIAVSGWNTLSGEIVASAKDEGDDGLPEATLVGADLSEVSVIYRPELEDLAVRLRVSSLPGAPAGGAPGVVYGLRLTVGNVRYEVRALRAAASTASPAAAPYFALYRCDVACLETSRLTGGFGTTGTEIRVAVPLSHLGAKEGAVLDQLRAYTSLGEAAAGEVVPADEVILPTATLPVSTAALGIAPVGTSEREVAFDTPATLVHGEMSGELDISSLGAGEYEVWMKGCLGADCGVASQPVTITDVAGEKINTVLELTTEGRGQDMVLSAFLTDLDSSDPVMGRAISFYSDGELIGSAQTNADGIAVVPVPPRHRGTNRGYVAVFEGDDRYTGSSDQATPRGA